MHRRQLLVSGLVAAGGASLAACASTGAGAPSSAGQPGYPTASGYGNGPQGTGQPTYTEEEIVTAGSNFLGVAAEALGGAVERIFMDQGGEPTAYIAGEEGAGAIALGVRYGQGLLYMKDQRAPQEVYWQGISIGWDLGGNASRVFTLVYNLFHPDMLYRRYPGVEGSAYLIGGLGVNYQRADGIELAPIRTGVGLRLGANVGTMSYSRQRNVLPF
jgi:hypothetical protein